MSVGGRLTGGDGGVRDDRTQIDRFPPATKSGCCEEVEEIVAALVQRVNEPDPTRPDPTCMRLEIQCNYTEHKQRRGQLLSADFETNMKL